MKRASTALQILLVTVMTLGLLSGCYSTGRAIGESLRSVEAKIDQFQEGYQDGRYGYFEGPSPFDVLEDADLRSEPVPGRIDIEEPVVPPISDPPEEIIEKPVAPEVPRGS